MTPLQRLVTNPADPDVGMRPDEVLDALLELAVMLGIPLDALLQVALMVPPAPPATATHSFGFGSRERFVAAVRARLPPKPAAKPASPKTFSHQDTRLTDSDRAALQRLSGPHRERFLRAISQRHLSHSTKA